MPVHVCTIAARNYLPFVRTLATSFGETHPGGRLTALIIDDVAGEVDAAAEPFELLRLEDLGTDVAELHRMAMLYDVTEFSTSLKPWLLRALLDAGAPAVLYLDPDIQVFSSLDDLADLAVRHGIVLTPHTTVPYPLDGKKTDDRTILAAGIYNLGCIGVSPAAAPFLAFWQERLSRECTIDPPGMRFVDQRWVDFAPGCYDLAIVRDTSYNVAYWNLHGRTLRWAGDRFEVDGRPLAFFHFSGYTPDVPYLLSRHQGDRPRILLSEHPDLARLADAYGTQLRAHGYGVDNLVPYGLATMADGTPVDRTVRHVYRGWVDEAEGRAPERSRTRSNGSLPRLPLDPFDPREVDQVIDQLNRPPDVEGDPGHLSIYFATLYGLRPDLHPIFPDPQGADRTRLLDWAAGEVAAGRLPKSLLVDVTDGDQDGGPPPGGIPTAARLAGTWAPPDALHPGIVVAGYLNAELGIGEGARLTARVVAATGLPFTTVGFRRTPSRQDDPFGMVGTDGRDLDVNVVVVNADQLAHFASEAGPAFFAGRYTIGQWAWELEMFPEVFWPALDLVDEVWAVSSFTRAAIASVTTKPVYAFPHPIVEPAPPDHVDRAALGIPDDRFTFLFCFDLFSILERKNPIGLITAFAQAFAPGAGPVLVVKVINGDRQVADLERIKWAARGRPDIVVIDHYLDAGENAALMAAADCYVSLHRSEGFGLTIAEAMALGKPVIATAYSGNLDFMDRDTAYLVPWMPGVVPAGCDPYPEGARWAEPDLAAAATLMRHVYGHPEEAAAKGRLARERVLAEHGLDQRAAFVRNRFAEIQATRARQLEAVARVAGTGSRQPGDRRTADLRRLLSRAGRSAYARLDRRYGSSTGRAAMSTDRCAPRRSRQW